MLLMCSAMRSSCAITGSRQRDDKAAAVVLAVVAAAAALLPFASAWDPWMLAQTPPMGFANWNGFGCGYNSSTIRAVADVMAASGLRDAGFRYVLIQECITPKGHRTKDGVMIPDRAKFPEGMPALVDYIHSKGLLAGICEWLYISAPLLLPPILLPLYN